MQISLPDSARSYKQASPIEKSRRRFREFLTKFNYDWTTLSASCLAYHLMIAVVPIGIAIIAVLGFTIGNLSPAAQAELLQRVKNAFPAAISSQNILQPALTKLHASAGFLSVLAVVFAILGGARLFMVIERCFAVVYRTSPRKVVPQYLMALMMMFVFIVLTPIMVFASSAPALILSLVRNSAINQLPAISQLVHNGFMLSLASICGSLLAAWILFQTTFMVVPHQKISFKKSWKGAVTATFLLEIFLALFPIYITHFMGSYTGVVGFAVIFLLFFYYFALILLLGAQVNAYFSEGVTPLPDTLAMVLADAVGRRSPGSIAASQAGSTTEYVPSEREDKVTQANNVPQEGGAEARKEPAAPSPQTSLPSQSTVTSAEHLHRETLTEGQAAPSASLEAAPKQNWLARIVSFLKQRSAARVAHQQPEEKLVQKGAIMPTLVGTAIAFSVTLVRLRKKTSVREPT